MNSLLFNLLGTMNSLYVVFIDKYRQVYETISSCIHDFFFLVQVVFMILFLMNDKFACLEK